MPTPDDTPHRFDPLAAILALAFPGAGHWFLGERKRAVLIASGVLGLFFSGLLVGGIDVVDSKEDRWWFVGQALVGPVAFATDYVHQNRIKGIDPRTGALRSANPDETRDASGRLAPALGGQRPPATKSLGKMNELGTLFACIAGMMNLIVALDAAFPGRREERA
ncbi:MAG: hypothetical protein KJZ54_01250 [Phycisphaerales bacterium]|nr:hypothetical protein [Phycisphaerales bacterium]